MKYKYLSHILNTVTPTYGGGNCIDIKIYKSIANKDSANMYRLSLINHCGTHIDAPNHFFDDGKKACDYLAGSWIFKSPQIIKVNLAPSEVLTCGDWCKKINRNSDILLFLSGWSKFRKKKKYILHNPGIHPEVGLYLRKNLSKVRAVGIDWISISSYDNRQLGREAHRAFLDPDGANKPVLIVEDMNLPLNLSSLREVFVFPMLVSQVDSVPCTTIGGFLD